MQHPQDAGDDGGSPERHRDAARATLRGASPRPARRSRPPRPRARRSAASGARSPPAPAGRATRRARAAHPRGGAGEPRRATPDEDRTPGPCQPPCPGPSSRRPVSIVTPPFFPRASRVAKSQFSAIGIRPVSPGCIGPSGAPAGIIGSSQSGHSPYDHWDANAHMAGHEPPDPPGSPRAAVRCSSRSTRASAGPSWTAWSRQARASRPRARWPRTSACPARPPCSRWSSSWRRDTSPRGRGSGTFVAHDLPDDLPQGRGARRRGAQSTRPCHAEGPRWR